MIVLVTDSTAYLTRQEANALHVTQVPMNYTHEGRIVYAEGCIDEEAEALDVVAGSVEQYSTAQASLAAFLSTLEDILSEGNQALVMTISSRFSGTYANARKAAQELGTDKVAVVDSKTTAGALYLLLKMARGWIDEGMGLAEVAARVREAREKTRTYFSVEDMTPLRKSGRLGFVRLSVSTILNIRPILKIASGGVTTFRVARGRNEQLRILTEAVTRHQAPVVVQHCRAEAMAGQLAQHLREAGIAVEVRLLGPVLAIHLGSGCLSVAWSEV